MITDHFDVSHTDYGTHVGTAWTLRPGAADIAALEVAESIVEVTVVDPARINAWKTRHDGGADHADTQARILQSFVRRAVGLPGATVGQAGYRDPHHVQASVAEHLWYQLTLVSHDHLGVCLLIDHPKWYVTAPGPDSVTIFRPESGDLAFRLWEIKKHSPASNVRRVVKEASGQMAIRGAEYIAEIVSVLLKQDGLSEEMMEFVKHMPDAWDGTDSVASAGVSVATDYGGYSTRALKPMPVELPMFAGNKRLVGLVAEIDVLADFSRLVQEHVWKGL
ncbi:MAG: hypothetical protein ACC652_15845 [Acidimicrobiales bacterium]